MYVLIVMTFLGESAWGPNTSMHDFTSQKRCQQAKILTLKMNNEMSKSNLAGGTSRREIIRVECIKK